MTLGEFRAITGVEVAADYYDKVIEPMYMVSALSKYDFCKLIRVEVLPRVERPVHYVYVCEEDYKENIRILIDIDIKHGKYVVSKETFPHKIFPYRADAYLYSNDCIFRKYKAV